MSNSIIEVNNLSKSYTITHEGRERYTALRDVMAQKAKKIFSFPSSLRGGTTKQSPYKEEFWALKDVSFKIEQGDRVGIIGRNGAGKSTLLKILSRITEPTAGEIKIKGRVASLLEVGTGFHPELTGRENIFLNGAILGMSRAEIKKHFDAIVDFAETEKFLDTPVKRYSSGMYVRLAFAVAAHLEPEILVVDEVLAVGDAEFQKKCLGKMEDVSKNEGRTVLFVSHNMEAIQTLTTRSIFLSSGKLLLMDKTNAVIDKYMNSADVRTNINDSTSRHGTGKAKIIKLIVKQNGEPVLSIKQGDAFQVEIWVDVYEKVKLDVSFVLEDFMQHAFSCSHFSDRNETAEQTGIQKFLIDLNVPYLRSGEYLCSIGLFRPDKTEYFDVVLHYPFLKVEGINNNSHFPIDDRWGKLYFDLKWKKIN